MNRLFSAESWSRLAGVILLAVLVLIRVADPIFVERIRLQAFDTYQQFRPQERPAAPVAILDIDDLSLTEVGQWPWPRTQVAEMTLKAFQAGAVAVAFDVLFSEPDRLSPGKIAEDNATLPEEIRASLSQLPSNDAALAGVFAQTRVVVGQSSVRTKSGGGGNTDKPVAVPHATLGPDPTPFMLRFPDLIRNLPILENAAAGRGVFTVLPDPDGVYRRVPVVMSVQGEFRLGLAIELLRVATGGNAFAIRSNDAGIDGVVVGGQLIRTEQDGTVWNNFSHSDRARFISATDLLNDRVPPGRLAGHLLLVGTSAIGLEDFRATPLGVPMAGVEIHAQVLENVLNQTLLTRPNFAIGLELVWIAGLSLLIIALAPMMRARSLIVATLVLAVGYLGFSFYLFSQERQLIDPTFPILATLLSAMLMATVNYVREELRRQRIRNAFRQYVAPDLVAQLADHPDKLVLGGRRKDLTILFSDVRGFTTISEGYRDDPAGLTQLMNRFLTVMSDAILEKDGTIDKYMGDAIMAFWNAPLDVENHELQACEAALMMVSAVNVLNQARAAEAAPGETVLPIRIGVGVNTGECIVGNMGSDKRFDYSTLGDPVNLASRLEGQTKLYGVQIIIGDTTRKAVGDAFAVFELDQIRVKGKSIPERIYALAGPKGISGTEAWATMSNSLGAALRAYRAQKWDDAEDAFERVAQIAPRLELDLAKFCEVYRDRISEFRANPPPGDWDGVFEATEK